MLRNKTVLKIFSVIFAVLLWMYIIAEVNPLVTRTLYHIPVKIINEQELEKQGLTVEDDQSLTVDLSVEVRRGDLHRLSKDRPIAEVDVSGCAKGKNTLPITVKMPAKASLAESEPEIKIEVVTEMAEKELPLHVKLRGKPPKGYAVKNAELPDVIKVSGPKLAVEKLTEIEALPVDLRGVREKTKLPVKAILPQGIKAAKDQPKLQAVIEVEKTDANP